MVVNDLHYYYYYNYMNQGNSNHNKWIKQVVFCNHGDSELVTSTGLNLTVVTESTPQEKDRIGSVLSSSQI